MPIAENPTCLPASGQAAGLPSPTGSAGPRSPTRIRGAVGPLEVGLPVLNFRAGDGMFADRAARVPGGPSSRRVLRDDPPDGRERLPEYRAGVRVPDGCARVPRGPASRRQGDPDPHRTLCRVDLRGYRRQRRQGSRIAPGAPPRRQGRTNPGRLDSGTERCYMRDRDARVRGGAPLAEHLRDTRLHGTVQRVSRGRKTGLRTGPPGLEAILPLGGSGNRAWTGRTA